MQAVVFHGIGDISLDDVSEPDIRDSHDAVVRITASAICGTDLHMIRGTMGAMKPGTILGHEGVGIVEKVGPAVRNVKEGERVIIPSTIACGYCSYCRAGYYAQCDNANPNGMRAGTCFFGGPAETGPVDGLQAEKARVPFANVGLVEIPPDVTDDEAILLSDIFPTGYFGAEMAEVGPGDTVAVFGCGPVGLFAILSSFLAGAGRVLAVDRVDLRLEMARDLGAEVIHFEKDDPVEAILELTGGIGVDRAIDAVGVDAVHADKGPAADKARKLEAQFREELKEVAPESHPHGNVWVPGNAPSQALMWACEALAKAGSLAIIGGYPGHMTHFPLGQAVNKNLTVNGGSCNHRRYIPTLLEMVQSGTVDLRQVLTQVEPLDSAISAYEAFDTRQPGWIKIELVPLAA